MNTKDMNKEGKVMRAMLMLGMWLAMPGLAMAQSWTQAEVRRVDRDAKKITLRHEAIANLEMPPMTMVFQAAEPAMLDAVKPGDRVRFEAEKIPGGYRVTRIETTGMEATK